MCLVMETLILKTGGVWAFADSKMDCVMPTNAFLAPKSQPAVGLDLH